MPQPEAVYFERVRVEGFGRFRGAVSARFPRRLGVLALPNERGKSTLVYALSAVLFGLPRSASPAEFGTGRFRHRDHPERFEGELVLLRGSERFRVLRRFDDHRVRLSVEEGGAWRDVCSGEHNPSARRPNPLYEAWLVETFGHASRTLFEATFCVVQPLPAPQKLDASLRALLDGGTGGGRTQALETLASAAKRLTCRTGALGITARDGRKEGEIEALDARIENLRRAVAESEALLGGLSEVREELAENERRLAELERRKAELEADRSAASDWLTARARARERADEAAALARALREARRADEAHRKAAARLAGEFPEFDGADPAVGEALLKWSELERSLRDLDRLREERERILAERRRIAAEKESAVDWDLEGMEAAFWVRAFKGSFFQAEEEWSRLTGAMRAREQAENEMARLRTSLGKLSAARLLALAAGLALTAAVAVRPEAAGAFGIAGAVLLLSFAALGDRIPPFSRRAERRASLEAEWRAAEAAIAASSLIAGEEAEKGRGRRSPDFIEESLGRDPVRLGEPWAAVARAFRALAGSRLGLVRKGRLETLGDLVSAMNDLDGDFWRSLEERAARYDGLNRELAALELALRRIDEREAPGVRRAAEKVVDDLERLVPADWGAVREFVRAAPENAPLKALAAACRPLERALAASGGDAGRAYARFRAWEGLRREAEKEKATLAATLAAWGCRSPADLDQRLALAEARLKLAVGELEAIASRSPALPASPDADPFEVQSRLDRVERELDEIRREAEARGAAAADLLRRRAELQGAATVNVAEARVRLAELIEERERLAFEAEALAAAYTTLKEAAEEYYADHVGRLSRAAGARFAALSGRPGRRVTISEELEVGAIEPGGAVLAVSQLSLGTQDLLYIALRLAIADLMAGGRRLPFLFDDPFVNFDRERLGRARETLLGIARERQVLLFTHRDELASWGEPIAFEAEGETP